MKRRIGSVFLAFVFLTVLVSGCAPAPTPLPPTLTASPVPPTVTPEPTLTSTATTVPSPTPLPGSVVLPVDTLGKSIPWLPFDETAKPGVNFIGFNTLKPPFNSALVRQAFAYSVDREALVEMAKKYHAIDPTPATTLTPPQTLGRDLYGVVGTNYDPQKAKDLFAQAGYSDPSSFPKVTLVVTAAGDIAPGARFNMANTMTEMWQTNLGVNVEVQAVQKMSDIQNQLSTGSAELFWMGWQADYNDPANFVGEIFNPNGDYHGEINFGHFSNSEFDEVINRAAKSNDPAERQALYIQAERILCETEAAIIPLFFRIYQ